MTRHPLLTVFMVVAGLVMLLPGVCAAAFMSDGLPRGPDALTFYTLWALCFLISAGGVFLLYRAFRSPPAQP
jgi:hypothetical protein